MIHPQETRLLICTQAVDLDDPILSFSHRWIEEFAKRASHVHVICLKEGRYNLPENVTVHSLGKETAPSRIKYLVRFYHFIFSLRNEYTAVFVHMSSEYAVLGGIPWRLMKKRIVLWYTHRQVNWKQRVALFFSHAVTTAAPESFRIKSKKVHAIGHGIDTSRFAALALPQVDAQAPRIVAVGRITPIKNLDIAIHVIAKLVKDGLPATLDLIGEPVTEEDKSYKRELEEIIRTEHISERVTFRGAVSNERMHTVYGEYDLSINLCPTGGIDKAVLESMAAGLPVLVANSAFHEYFNVYASALMCAYRDVDDTAHKIRSLFSRSDIAEIQQVLRESAKKRADVAGVVSAIMERLYPSAK